MAKINDRAQVNILPKRILDKLGIVTDLKPSKATLEGCSGAILDNMETIKLNCRPVNSGSPHSQILCYKGW